MRDYWVIAPYDARYPDVWETVWKHDLEQGIISIGWRELGDVSTLGEEELAELIRRIYPQYIPATVTLVRRMLYEFHHSVKAGDRVLARRGLKRLAATGTVKRAAYFDPKKNSKAFPPGEAFASHLDVKWDQTPRDLSFSEFAFRIPTIYKVTEDQFRALTQNGLINVEEQDLTTTQIDNALRRNGLRFGYVATDSKQAQVRQRRGQARLRKLTVENYRGQCAVCDIADNKLLIASHIVGWAAAPKYRGELSNVICLCRIHDALFEAGYWSLGNDLKVLTKNSVRSKTIRELLRGMSSFRKPVDFPPGTRFLRRHRKQSGFEV